MSNGNNGHHVITTERLLEMARRGSEARKRREVRHTVAMGPCDVTFILPPPGELDRRLADARKGVEKKFPPVMDILKNKTPDEIAAAMITRSDEEKSLVRDAENQVYADYIVDIRDREVSPDGRSMIRPAWLADTVYLEGYADLPEGAMIEYSREIALLILGECSTKLRDSFITLLTSILKFNAASKEAELGNSGLSRSGAPANSQPAGNAPNEGSSNSSAPEPPSSTSTETQQEGSMTTDGAIS